MLPIPTIHRAMISASGYQRTYVDFDHLLNRCASSGKHSNQVPAAELRLISHGALDEGSRAVHRDLTRDEDLAVCLDGLGLEDRVPVLV